MTLSPKLEIVDIIYTQDSFSQELSVEVTYFLDQPEIDPPKVYIATFRLNPPLLADISIEYLANHTCAELLPELITLLNNDRKFKGCVDSYQEIC